MISNVEMAEDSFDMEWVELMWLAKNIGLTASEVKEFLSQRNK